MSIPWSIKAGEWLYQYVYTIYKPLYFWYKNKEEKFEIELIKKTLKKHDNVVDIGANIGFYTTIFSQLISKNGCVYAFEPDKDNFEKLKKNIQYLKNVVLENKAVSNQSGMIQLYQSKLNVDHRTYPSNSAVRSIDIECVSLDDYFRKNERIHFIKMDIQGYEPFALQGMINVLTYNDKLKLISEFWPHGLIKAGYSAIDYFYQLKKFFPAIYLIDKNELRELNEEIISTLKVSESDYYNIFASR